MDLLIAFNYIWAELVSNKQRCIKLRPLFIYTWKRIIFTCVYLAKSLNLWHPVEFFCWTLNINIEVWKPGFVHFCHVEKVYFLNTFMILMIINPSKKSNTRANKTLIYNTATCTWIYHFINVQLISKLEWK